MCSTARGNSYAFIDQIGTFFIGKLPLQPLEEGLYKPHVKNFTIDFQ